MEVKRGDIFIADLTAAQNLGKSVQAGKRPVIIISTDKGNKFSPNVNVVPLSTKVNKVLPPHLTFKLDFLKHTSIVLNENIMTIGKELLKRKLGRCPEEVMQQVKEKLIAQLNLY